MRLTLLPVAALVLAACGETHAPAPEKTMALRAAQQALAFRAASETARMFTGDLSIDRDGVTFAKGARLDTRTLTPREADELTSRGGDSFAAIALSSGDLRVEVRGVVSQRLQQGAPSLCPGDLAPTFIALVYGRRDMRVTLLLFTGADEPGPDATDSQVCATYAYATPDGARTRQGVVL